jgi:hypothetical protein
MQPCWLVLAKADRVHDASAVGGAEARDGHVVLPSECGSGPDHRACCNTEHLQQHSTVCKFQDGACRRRVCQAGWQRAGSQGLLQH